MLFMNKKINFKKMISVSATALALTGFGGIAINHVNHIPVATQIVKAATVSPSDVHYDEDTATYSINSRLFERELISNGEAHARNWHLNGYNSVKPHWYRRPQLRNEFPNTDASNYNHIDYDANVSQPGFAWVVGTIRINGRNMYLVALSSSTVIVEDTANINKAPRLYQARNITLYNDDNSNVERVGKGSLAVMVPYYHQAITLPNAENGKLGRYIPVLATPDGQNTASYLISLSDYNKINHQGQPRTVYMKYMGHIITAGNHGRGHINTSRIKRAEGYYYRKQRNGAYALTRGRHHRANQSKALRQLKRSIAYHTRYGFYN